VLTLNSLEALMRNLLLLARKARLALAGILLLASADLATAAEPTLADFGHGRMLSRSTWPLLVVMVEFDDRTFPNNTTNWWDRFAFDAANNPPGLAAYFKEVSLGRFAWTRGSVIRFSESATNRYAAWLDRTTNNPTLQYHSNLVHKAILAAPEVFAQHDFNKSGYVTPSEMHILMLTVGEGGGLRWAGQVKPHGASTGWHGEIVTSNVEWEYGLHISCHELAHLLGTIDLYGVWGGDDQDLHKQLSVMGAGSPARPVHLDPWHKLQLGWCEPRIIPLRDANPEVIPAAQMQHPNAPLLYYDPDEGTQEYWLLEYRTRTASVPSTFEAQVGEGGDGLLIWHIYQNPDHSAPLYGVVAYPDASSGWRECVLCRGLFSINAPNKTCPSPDSTTGAHDPFVDDHRIVKDKPEDPGQHGWRSCTKCAQLFFGPNAAISRCPADGQHAAAAPDYALMMDTPEIVGHNKWKRCTKCQVLYYSPRAGTSVCPASGLHAASTNTYVLITGWAERTVLTEGCFTWDGNLRFLLGGNRFWQTNSATPHLTFFDRRLTRFRVEVGGYFNGTDGLIVNVVGDAFVDFGYSGFERGSLAQPFNTFIEGVTHVSPGANVIVRTGATPETARVTKPMTIRASQGPATIGQR
jgi:M6 family metalloprotease-like protein